MDLNSGDLVEIGIDAMTTDAPSRRRTCGPASSAPRRRTDGPGPHPGWANGSDGLSTHAAFITTATELYGLLDSLTDDDWTRATDVQDRVSLRELVLHLVGVERYMLGQLGRRAVLDAPHRPTTSRCCGRPPPTSSARTPHGSPAAMARRAGPHRGDRKWDPTTRSATTISWAGVQGMLIIRTFELWTHDDDIRRAVGLPANLLDDARLGLMSSTRLGLPFGMARAGTTRPGRTVRIDLTGPGRHLVRDRLTRR